MILPRSLPLATRWLLLLTIVLVIGSTAPAHATSARSNISHRLAALIGLAPAATSASGLQRNSAGTVLIELHMRDTAPATRDALAAAGAKLRYVSARYAQITAYAALRDITAIAALDPVVWVDVALPAVTRGAPVHSPRHLPRQTTAAATCPTGLVTEGDIQLRAKEARTAFGVSGAGISVGVISDSYDATTGAVQDIANAELPGSGNPCGAMMPVRVLAEGTNGADEGRAMLQIIHDLAPDAGLLFASAGDNPAQMADHIRALAAAGADVIVDDIFFPGSEPFFQDGPINLAINEVVAQGVVYLAAAGNANIVDASNHNVTSYEAAAYRPTACPAALNVLGTKPKDCHNFATSGAADPTNTYRLGSGGYLAPELQWAEPFDGVQTDLSIFLIDTTANRIAFGANEDNIAQQQPIEYPKNIFQNPAGSNHDYALVISRFAGGGTPRIKYVFQDAGNIVAAEYNASTDNQDLFGPSVGDHVASAGALGIAAVRYNTISQPEPYSSLGPAMHYFGPVSTVAAAPLAQPERIERPDVAATDGGVNSFFGSSTAPYRFYGTSAAAPHAAAVVALTKQRAQQLGKNFDRGLVESVFETTAHSLSGGSIAQNGAGLIDTFAALNSLGTQIPLSKRAYFPLASR